MSHDVTAPAVSPPNPTTTRVVHVNDHVDGAVYVGRATRFRPDLKHSKWGNPFGVKRHGRDGAIFLYRQGLVSTGSIPLIADLPVLRGKALACWCRRDGEERTAANACHADVLVDLLNRYTDDELRAMDLPVGDEDGQTALVQR